MHVAKTVIIFPSFICRSYCTFDYYWCITLIELAVHSSIKYVLYSIVFSNKNVGALRLSKQLIL